MTAEDRTYYFDIETKETRHPMLNSHLGGRRQQQKMERSTFLILLQAQPNGADRLEVTTSLHCGRQLQWHRGWSCCWTMRHMSRCHDHVKQSSRSRLPNVVRPHSPEASGWRLSIDLELKCGSGHV